MLTSLDSVSYDPMRFWYRGILWCEKHTTLVWFQVPFREKSLMNSNFVLVWINSFGTSLQLVSHRSSLFGSQLDPPLVKIIYHMYKQNNQSHFREQWCHDNTTLTLVGYSATFSPSWTLMTGIQQLIPIRNKLSTRFFPGHSALSLKGLETKLSYLCHLVCSKLALWLMLHLLSPVLHMCPQETLRLVTLWQTCLDRNAQVERLQKVKHWKKLMQHGKVVAEAYKTGG